MGCTLVMGNQWGDEGKGKVVDYLAKNADVVVRFNGGANAGHTIVIDNEKYVSRLIPSGYMYHNKELVITQGVMLDIEILMNEIKSLPKTLNIEPRLFISEKAHLVLPYHKLIDSKDKKIGTTGKGIGPAFADKVNRVGLRVLDLKDLWKFRKTFLTRQLEEAARHQFDFEDADEKIIRKQVDEWMGLCEEFVSTFKNNIVDTSCWLRSHINSKSEILLEGAQGTMLDLDHGTYPFVTSSNCVAPAASLYTGIPMKHINKVIGVFKAYTTRVGNGPFPTEFEGPMADRIREKGNEFGSVTKRPRRIGWLDLPALNETCWINGIDSLIITKYDVLEGLGFVKYAAGYKYHGHKAESLAAAFQISENCMEIEYRDFDTVTGSVGCFIEQIQKHLKTPITMYSDGPGRDEIHPVLDI
jgi:adenylosuccinate synthase